MLRQIKNVKSVLQNDKKSILGHFCIKIADCNGVENGSTLLPETAGEEDDDWEDFETANEHEEGAYVFGCGAEDCP